MGGLHCEATSGPSQELTIPLNKLHFWRLANSQNRCDDLDALAVNIIIRAWEMPVAEHRLNHLHSLDRFWKAFTSSLPSKERRVCPCSAEFLRSCSSYAATCSDCAGVRARMKDFNDIMINQILYNSSNTSQSCCYPVLNLLTCSLISATQSITAVGSLLCFRSSADRATRVSESR